MRIMEFHLPACLSRGDVPGDSKGSGRCSRMGLIIVLLGLTTTDAGFAAPSTPDTSVPSPQSATALSNLQNAFTNIAEELEPTVVTVYSKAVRTDESDGAESTSRGVFPKSGGPKTIHGTGSGVIIRRDGWILTNDHVVSGADRVTVKLHDGREFVGTVRRDYRSDLALIKVVSPTSLPAARLGDSDATRIGHWAIAIGSPYRYEGSFSVGVISSLFRQHRIRDMDARGIMRLYPNMIQTDAAINPGNSGGPLVNIDGQVIGINTAIESDGGGSLGIGFAIPINTAKFVVDQLMTKGKVSYGYLGVAPKDVTPQQAIAFGVSEGAWLDEEPQADNPAGKAGLHAGDVITAVNGKPVHGELDLRTVIAHTRPSTSVEITYLRDRRQKTVKTTLTEANAQDYGTGKIRDSAKPGLGLEVQPITDKLASNALLPPDTTGVVVKSIDISGSSADVDDLTVGSVLIRINDTNTPTLAAYRSATEGLKSGDQVRVLFQNRDGRHFRVLQID